MADRERGGDGSGVGALERIDVHAHAVPEAYARGLERDGERFGVRIERAAGRAHIVARHYRGPADGAFSDLDQRLADMDGSDTLLQVVSPPAAVVSPWAEADAGAAHARLLNDSFAELAASRPERLSAFGILPLQAPDRAARELERLRHDLRLPGVLLPTSVDGGPLDDPALDPIYEAAAALGAVLFVHPTGPVGGAQRLARHGLTGGAAFPHEVALAALELVLGGVLDRHPSLRVLLAHGGGSLAWILPRVERSAVQGLVKGTASPAGALARFRYDTVMHDPEMLRRLLRLAGSERVLYGTDHPSGLGDPGGAVAMPVLGELGATERGRVLRENAKELLGFSRELS